MPDPIPHLPGEWTCSNCGKTAAMAAVIRPIDDMGCSERDTLEVYGKWKGNELLRAPQGMFTNGVEIELCGDCGHSYWSAPKCAAVVS